MMNKELIPTEFWGLDPLFQCHVKLYIKDILSLKQVEDYPGIFQYQCHPVTGVDIQGVVVRVEERDKLDIYAVDDGTGVISCTRWKAKQSSQQKKLYTESLPKELFDVLDGIDKLHCYLKHGDLVHIQGKLKLFRNNIEITASHCVRITDSNKEMERMMLLPILYSECYSKPVILPKALTSLVSDAKVCLHTELKRALLPEICQLKVFSREQLLKSDALDSILRKSPEGDDVLSGLLSDLEKGGYIFKRFSSGHHSVFVVTCECAELKEKVRLIIQQWIQKHGDEDGCPHICIFDELRRSTEFDKITMCVLSYCLDYMESNSDIISTAENKYITFED